MHPRALALMFSLLTGWHILCVNVGMTLKHDIQLAMAMGKAAIDSDRPVLCFLTPTRRCNLSCGYCNEYDDTSLPVATSALRERITHLAKLHTALVTFNGGEPLLHPDLPALVAFVRECGMTPSINTNGFLLSRASIEAFNEAGLFMMQVSVDSVRPNLTTQKSLKTLRPRLELLSRYAKFRVRTNTVLGAAPASEALEVVRFVQGLGFGAKVALGRQPNGAPSVSAEEYRSTHQVIQRMRGRHQGVLSEDFQQELLDHGSVQWKCRAGARYFHVCENGLVHLCGVRLGEGTKPLLSYAVADLREAFDTERPCAASCAVAYAHQTSALDRWRPQRRREQRVRHLTVVPS